MPRNPRHDALRKDTNIDRWFRSVAQGHRSTAKGYIRRLGKICEDYRVTPQQLAAMTVKELNDWIIDLIDAEVLRGSTRGFIKAQLNAIKSWLDFSDVHLTKRFKVPDVNKTSTRPVPTEEELREVLGVATPQARAIIGLMMQGGFRPEVLGSGDDGLRLSDLPDLEIHGSRVEFAKIPALIVVRREISKKEFQYLSFIGAEACEYLVVYLNLRLQQGEKLTPESDLISPWNNFNQRGFALRGLTEEHIKDGIWDGTLDAVEVKVAVRGNLVRRWRKRFVTPGKIGSAVRRSYRAAGFSEKKWRPYELRCFHSTQLFRAEVDNLIPHALRMFWEGHTGDMSAHYSTNKNWLPPKMIEEMRAAYKRCEHFLSTKHSQAAPVEGLEEKEREVSSLKSQVEQMRAQMAGLAEVVSGLQVRGDKVFVWDKALLRKPRPGELPEHE